MEELIKRLELVIQIGVPDKDGMHPINAETVLEVARGLSEHSTNLAEVGTDCISRQAAIDALHMDTSIIPFEKAREYADATISEIRNRLEKLPPAQPEIIRCRECKFASGDSRICMKFDHSPIGELDFCSFAERREVNNESN